MHSEAYDFVKSQIEGREFNYVVEFGSKNINGSIRNLFDCKRYWGIDIVPGHYVDEVADASNWLDLERRRADCIVCCEVLEHTESYPQIIENASRNLKVDGLFIVTCASTGRAPHSAIDGGALKPNEYYKNVTPIDFIRNAYKYNLKPKLVEHHEDRGDLYSLCIKER